MGDNLTTGLARRRSCLPASIILARTVGLLADRPPRVDKLRRRGDVPGLLGALMYAPRSVDRDGVSVDRGAPTRAAAVIALAEADDPAVPGALVGALADRDERVRAAARDALSSGRA